MQVATLFRDNVILLGSASNMNTSSESTLTSLEEEEEETTKISVRDNFNATHKKLPLSVSSLVSLASTALLGNNRVRTVDITENEEENNKEEKEENINQDNSTTITRDEDDRKEKVKLSHTLYNGSSVSLSPSSIDSKGHRCETAGRSSPSSLENHLVMNEAKTKSYRSNFDDCKASNQTPSQDGTLPENETSFKQTLLRHEQHFPESNRTEINVTSSSAIPSTIKETHGCATNKISDIDEMEAENLVIRQHDHSNSVPRETASSDTEMDHLLHSHKECDEGQEMDIEPPQNQQAHQQQMEFERHQINQQQQLSQERLSAPEEQGEAEDNSTKHNQYAHAHQYHECIRNDLELSQQNIRDHHTSQNQMDSNIEDYRKMQNLPSSINMSNHMDQQHQYHHLNHSQHQLQHQQAQQLYLQHHDQQHMIHHHHHQQHQQQQHSELMAYLHHQDQQAMQQPHHIRTYQHYQQQQQRIHQLPHPQPPSPHHQQKQASMTCIDDLMIDEFNEDPNNRYKLLSPTVKHESQDDGYETSAGDVLTPNSHSSSHSITPQHQIHSTNLAPPKCEDISSSHHTDPDPYNFIDEEMNSNIRLMSPSSNNGISMVLRHQNYGSSSEGARLLIDDGQTPMRMESQHIVGTSSALQMQVSNTDDLTVDTTIPKKRGRKKKCADEISTRTMVDGILKPILQKERKKHDRFNGMSEEEVAKRTLPDHLTDNLDIIIIGINPGLFAAYKGHHYAGPGNHFWKCLYLSGLTQEQMTAEEDYKLLKFGIGFTNMVERATKGSADLTRKEIKEGSRILLDKLKRFRPKIAVFNGKLIFEVFSGKKDFNFGRQQECVEGTDTYMWVMPSSSARCAQLPRAADKVPFYAALKKFRDYLNGLIPHIDDLECVFNDPKAKQCCESESKGNLSPVTGPFLAPDCLNNENLSSGYNNSNSSTPERGSITDLSTNPNNNNGMNIMHKESPIHSLIGNGDNNGGCSMALSGINGPNPINLVSSVMHMPCNLDQSGQPEKKKRGRPKKIKGVEGEDGPIPQKVRNTNSLISNGNNILNLTLMGENGETPKKKRGRPKKIKAEIGVNPNLGSNIIASSSSSNSSNNGRVSASNPMENSIGASNATKADICLHRNSPSGTGNHQILSINNSNQFNSQAISQQQPLQNQRLFTSPMHSPNTISSYCPMGMNAPTTPPTANTTNSNLSSSGAYHQQQHGNSHHLQPHQHNHVLQRAQHQLHLPPGMYMPSPNHNPHQSSKSPHYASSHSDLSTEISAAISSEHLCESQSESSPAMGAVDYDRPDSIPNEEHSGHDLRFTSPTSNAGESQQGSGSTHQLHHYHSIYQNPGTNQTYLSTNSSSVLGSAPCETGATNSNEDGINYIVSTRAHTSNSNASTPQPAQIQGQQRNLQISDVTSKSLSGLESLVDQIPTIAEGETQNSLTNAVGSVECRIKSDSNEGFPSPASGGSSGGSSVSGGIGCIYIPSYSNLNSSTSSSPSSAAPSNSSILSPHHYPDPIYSTANTCPSSTNTNSNNNINYNGLASNFSVSSLTSNNYPANSYHTNLMAAATASSPHHITSTATSSPMYMDPHMPVAVSPIYHHPYAQHTGYGAYSTVGPPPPPPPPTLHMPSPNYPYAYANTSGYPSQSAHHPSHSSAAGYLTNHPSMFDRIKPDIGYGGY